MTVQFFRGLRAKADGARRAALAAAFEAGSVSKAVVAGIVLLLAAFVALFVHQYHIDDDPGLKPSPRFVVDGGSKAVAMAATWSPIRRASNMRWPSGRPR
jgi:hypothetical protein